MRSLTPAALASINAQTTDECYITLVTITSDALVDPLRVADDPFELLPVAGQKGVVSRGDEYVFLPFDLSLPNQDDTGIGRAKITIDNVSREIVQAIRQTAGQINLKIEIVLATDVDTPEVALDNFILDSVNYDSLTITGSISVQYYDLEQFPQGSFNPSQFSGLF